MIDADPQFVDVANGDVHLTHGSSCQDTGTNAAVGIQPADFEKGPCPFGSAADMGVDVFPAPLYYAGQATRGGSIDIKMMIGASSSPSLWAFSLNPTPLHPPAKIPAVGDLYLDPPFLFGFARAISANGVALFVAYIPVELPGTV